MSDDPTLTLAAAATEYAKAVVADREACDRWNAAVDTEDEGEFWDAAWQAGDVVFLAQQTLCRAALVANGVEP